MKPKIDTTRLYNRNELIELLKLEGCIWHAIEPVVRENLSERVAADKLDEFVSKTFEERFKELFVIDYICHPRGDEERTAVPCITIWGTNPESDKDSAWDAVLAFEIQNTGFYVVVDNARVINVGTVGDDGEEEIVGIAAFHDIHRVTERVLHS